MEALLNGNINVLKGNQECSWDGNGDKIQDLLRVKGIIVTKVTYGQWAVPLSWAGLLAVLRCKPWDINANRKINWWDANLETMTMKMFFKDNRNFNWNWILPIVKNQKMFQVVKGCQCCLRGFPELYKIIQNTRQAIFRERFFGNVQNIDSESNKDDRWKFEHFNVLSLKSCCSF